MNGAIPERPDPEWLKTLREGDRVAVAERGRLIYEAEVKRITPGGLLKVGHSYDSLGAATAFCGPTERSSHRRRPGYATGTGLYSSRYLVPVSAERDTAKAARAAKETL